MIIIPSDIKRLKTLHAYIQNTLARLVAGSRKRDHITPVLKDLHWLPVEQRINYKIALTTHKILQDKQPAYLAELVSLHKPAKGLRSSSQSLIGRHGPHPPKKLTG